jgi:hypothetical protein
MPAGVAGRWPSLSCADERLACRSNVSSGKCAVGDRVRVLWPPLCRSFKGTVKKLEAGRILVSYDDGDCSWAEQRAGEWTDVANATADGAPVGKQTPSDAESSSQSASRAAGLTLREIFDAKMAVASAATTVKRSQVGSEAHEGPQRTHEGSSQRLGQDGALNPVKRNLSGLLTNAIGLFTGTV